jgi:hypothetical protein
LITLLYYVQYVFFELQKNEVKCLKSLSRAQNRTGVPML